MTQLKKQRPKATPSTKLVHAPAKEYRYPLRSGNQFELSIDGENFFPRIFSDIRAAKRFVFIEMYLSASGKVFDEFSEAVLAARANKVEVYLLLDDFGAAGVSQEDRKKLTDAGVKIAFYNPIRFFRFKRNLHRTHRKVIIIDEEVAWTGGLGLIDVFMKQDVLKDYWHDTMVRVTGPCVDDWLNLFRRAWNKWTRNKQPLPDLGPSPSQTPNTCGRVVMNRSARDSEIRRSLMQHIEGASQRVWLCAPYFVPSRALRKLICKAAKRGLDVRLLLPGPLTDNAGSRYMARRYYRKLLKSGVEIYEFQPRFIHAKVMLVDDWASVGSSNLDRWNLIWNLDANQEIHDTAFGRDVAQFFETDFPLSDRFNLETWKQRPLTERFTEKFWGAMVYLASKFSRGAEKHKLI